VLSTLARRLFALGALLGGATGCAEHLQLAHDGPGAFSTGRLFWPPPRASSVWVGEHPIAAGSLREVAARLSRALDDAGYRDARLIPVGLEYAHGFAIATRLEKVAAGGLSCSGGERWSPLYAEPPELRWLAFASSPELPPTGRYRALLVSFSDLPLVSRNRPPIEDEWTVMDGPDVPRDAPLPVRGPGPRYRLSLHVYEFEAVANERSSRLDDVHASEPAAATAARLALVTL